MTEFVAKECVENTRHDGWMEGWTNEQNKQMDRHLDGWPNGRTR